MASNTGQYIRWFNTISMHDTAFVGGKNASLGEMYCELSGQGVQVPNGFAITSEAYRVTLTASGLTKKIETILKGLDTSNIANLQERGAKIRDLIQTAPLPAEIEQAIVENYQKLCDEYGEKTDVAVRSSATAEDLPDASFAGQQDTYLNIRGAEAVVRACRNCYASLFTDRAISYRFDKHFDHLDVALSVGVQKMVRSDLACSGVMFSIDPESGFKDVVLITGSYGLGELIVQGAVNPDEVYVFKPTLNSGFRSIISKKLGSKDSRMVYETRAKEPLKVISVPAHKRREFILSDDEFLTLARWACSIEDHYSKKSGRFMPMDIEWAKDGATGKIFIVQARPETVISQRDSNKLVQYQLKERSNILARGQAAGNRIGRGKARVLSTLDQLGHFQMGEVLVAEQTDPNWEPIMKLAGAIVTEKGGRTSHAAIVSRELGIPCVVGASHALEHIATGMGVTVSCAEGEQGVVYEGLLNFEIIETDIKNLPRPKTKAMLNVGNPEAAFTLAALPNDGVGLARLEFIINSHIGIHPLALLDFSKLKDQKTHTIIAEKTQGYGDKAQFFVDKLAEGTARIGAAFYPNPVIVRLSDFKSNEYAGLIGGSTYEPKEENPMIGWRGASRYISDGYRRAFALECQAMKRVRDEFGLSNVKLMIPFCRTLDEGKKVIAEMKFNGLVQGENGLEIIAMCEIPSNVILADQFLDIFDGFSIGSNDLTQLTLGIDRDSELVAHLLDERNDAVKMLVSQVIKVALKKGKYIGICGDAPSTHMDFLRFLINEGIQSVSFSPDAAIGGWLAIAEQEAIIADGLKRKVG